MGGKKEKRCIIDTYLDEGIDGLASLKGAVGKVVEALDQVAYRGQHAHTAVLQLSGAVVANGLLVLALLLGLLGSCFVFLVFSLHI